MDDLVLICVAAVFGLMVILGTFSDNQVKQRLACYEAAKVNPKLDCKD